MTDIVQTDDVMGGQPRLEGRRISVLQIAEWILEQDMAPETVSSEFDLSLADIYGALAYYYENIDDMEEWRERRNQRIEESRDESFRPESFSEPA